MPITSKPIAAAEAIVDLLEQGLGSDSFSETFTVERAYRPVQRLEDLAVDAMKVTVIPAANEIAQASRGFQRYDVTCAIVVQCRKSDTLNATLDPLMELVDEIVTYLAQFDVTFQSSRMALGNDPIFVGEHIKDQQVFTSVVNVTYRIHQTQTEV